MILALFFIAGLAFGSFLNVAAYRLPNAENAGENAFLALCMPGSFCPHCKTPLSARHLVPLFSFLFLRGKSACCQKRIGWRYPVVEVIGGLIVVAAAVRFGTGWENIQATILASAFAGGLLAASVADMARYILPDVITLPLLWLGLLANIDGRFVPLDDAVWGAAGGYVAMLMLAEGAAFCMRRPALGGGDKKLFAAAGAWIGWQDLPFVLFGGAFFGLILFVLRQLIRGKALNAGRGYVPFGPCIALAAAMMLFYGDAISGAYWRFIGG
ncbi:MAG: prepilin peptidase [Gammaproteobacteria bacterium]